MNLIQKSMSGKIVENEHGRAIYSDSYDECSHPKNRKFLDKSLRQILGDFWGCDAGMATLYSDGITKARAGRRAKPYEIADPLVTLIWKFASLPAGNIGDILVCGKIFSGELSMGGVEAHGALSSAGGAATGAYGTYLVATDGISLGAVVDVDEYLAAADWDAAGTTLIGNTVALSYQLLATADWLLCATNTTEAFATAGVVSGHFHVVR